jgi:hypothetical protein
MLEFDDTNPAGFDLLPVSIDHMSEEPNELFGALVARVHMILDRPDG